MIEARDEDVAVKYSLINKYIGGFLYVELQRMKRAGKLEVHDKTTLLSKKLMPENELYYNMYKEGKMTYEEFHTGNHEKLSMDEILEFANNKEVDHLMEMVGCGTNRVAFRCKDFIVKIALDDLGEIDNMKEMVYSKRLQPYATKVYEVSHTGLISVQEYVRVLDLSEFDERRADMLEILEDIQKSYLFGDIGANTKNISNWGVRRDTDELCILDFAYIYKVDSSKFECFEGCKCGENGDPAYLRYDASYTNLVCPVCNKRYTFQDFKNIDGDAETLEMETIKDERQYRYKGKVYTTVVGQYSTKTTKDPKTGTRRKVYEDKYIHDVFYVINSPEEMVLRSKEIDTIKEKKEKKLTKKRLLRLEIEREELDELAINDRKKYEKTIAKMSEKKYNRLFNTDFETGEEIKVGKNKRKISKIKVDDWYDDTPREELLRQEQAFIAGEITYEEWINGDMSNYIPGVKVEDRDNYDGTINRNGRQESYDDIDDFLDDITPPTFDEQPVTNVCEPEEVNEPVELSVKEDVDDEPVVIAPQYVEPPVKKKIVKTRETKFEIGGPYGTTKLAISDGIGKTVVDLTKDDLVVDLSDGAKCMDISNTIVKRVLTSYYPSAILSITEYNNIVRDKGIDKDRITFIKTGNYVLCYVMNRRSMTNFFGTLSSNYTTELSTLMNVYANLAYKHEFYNKDNQLFDINKNVDEVYNTPSLNDKDAFIDYFKKVSNPDLDVAVCYDYDALMKDYRKGMYYITEDGYFMDDENDDISDNEDMASNEVEDSDELPIIRKEVANESDDYNDEDVDIDITTLFGDDDDVSFEDAEE